MTASNDYMFNQSVNELTAQDKKDIKGILEGRITMRNLTGGLELGENAGGPEAEEAYDKRKIREAYTGVETPRTVTEGELPLKYRDLEATRRYAARDTVARANEKLVASIRAKNDLTRRPEVVADGIREAAYVEVAKISPYESERLEIVAQVLERAAATGNPQLAIREMFSHDASEIAEATDADILKALKGIK